jgi:hypothetical protein
MAASISNPITPKTKRALSQTLKFAYGRMGPHAPIAGVLVTSKRNWDGQIPHKNLDRLRGLEHISIINTPHASL